MSKLNSKKSASDYFKQGSGDLKPILAKIREIDYLSHKIAAYFDPSFKKDYQLANIKDNCLILLTSNASVATQLRFQIPDFLQQFQKDPQLRKIRNISCKVSPALRINALPYKMVYRKVERLSVETAHAVQSAARGIKDERLREIMERIAENRKDSPFEKGR